MLLLDAALRRVCDTLDAGGAAFLRDGDRLAARLGRRASRRRRRARPAQLQVGDGAPRARGDPARAGGRTDPARAGRRGPAFRAAHGDGPLVAVPLLAKAHARRGARALSRAPGGRELDRATSASSRRSACSSGVAVENARLFSDVRRRLSDLEAVHALALRIFENAPGDVRALLEDGCREVARALSARAAAVLLADGDGRTLRGVAAYGAPMDPTELRISLEDGRARGGGVPAARPGLEPRT